MAKIKFPYGRGNIEADIPDKRLKSVLVSGIHDYDSEKTEEGLVEAAILSPTASPTLSELAVGKNNIVIIASDHTRPVPSRVIIPAMLNEIHKGNPEARVTILIATGCHRGTTKEELRAKFGDDILSSTDIMIHDCDDTENLVKIGTLPSGGELCINRIAAEADLLLAEGFIEPHFFAGFSGGRKSVLPGVASRASVMANHCAEFIDNPYARTGMLECNPIHRDMIYAAECAKLAFIVNVVINSEKKVIYAVAGAPAAAHEAGCDFLSSLCKVTAEPVDIVITTNGGYPLDQNVYQSVKGMTAGEAIVKEGGVIIMLSESSDGVGGEDFYHQLADGDDIMTTMKDILSHGRDETIPDQWQTQVFLRVMMKAHIIYISSLEDDTIRALHLIPAHSIEEALTIADSIVGVDSSIAIIPDGVSVMAFSE